MREGTPARTDKQLGPAVHLSIPPSSREEEILQAALRLFRQKGYHATSVQDIADAVGLQKGSLYHYITSKEELLGRIFQRALTPLLEQAERIAASEAPAPEQLRQLLHAHVQAVCQHEDELTVYLDEWRMLDEAQFQALAEQRHRYQRLLEGIVQSGIESGAFRPVDVQLVAFALLGMANWLYHWYRPSGRLRPPAIANRFADLVLRGLEPREPIVGSGGPPKATNQRPAPPISG